jgi:hypothetical protein
MGKGKPLTTGPLDARSSNQGPINENLGRNSSEKECHPIHPSRTEAPSLEHIHDVCGDPDLEGSGAYVYPLY